MSSLQHQEVWRQQAELFMAGVSALMRARQLRATLRSLMMKHACQAEQRILAAIQSRLYPGPQKGLKSNPQTTSASAQPTRNHKALRHLTCYVCCGAMLRQPAAETRE